MLAINLISSARNLDSEFRYLTIRLRLERQRLINWSSEIGLLSYLEGAENSTSNSLLGLSRQQVLDTLLQIQATALEFIKDKNKYKNLVPDEDASNFLNVEKLMLHVGDWSLEHFPDASPIFKRPGISIPLLQELPKRLRWASCDKDRYSKLITRFRGLNDALIDLADSDARRAIREATRETNTNVLHLHSKIEELLQLTKALTPDSSPNSPSSSIWSTTSSHASDAESMQQLAEFASFKAVSTTVQSELYVPNRDDPERTSQSRKLKLARSDFYLFDESHKFYDRCEADYSPANGNKQRVWIEWREYDPIYQGRSDLNLNRVDRLAALLCDAKKPDSLRVPHCLGYFDDAAVKANNYRRGRLGFVFQKPTVPNASPISLKHLLQSRSKPLLTDRIALAKALSNCIMSLHSVNWLHKAIRSDNILFFIDDGSFLDYSSLFLSGFGYSRPAYREDMTEQLSENPEHDIYRHPRTHGLGPWEGRQGFKRTFDIYSLGVVLMEIAHWKLISEVLDISDTKTLDAVALRNIQSRLLNEKVHLRTVGSDVGRRFRDATQSCLDPLVALGVEYLDDENDSHVGARISQNFYHRVLRPLEEIRT